MTTPRHHTYLLGGHEGSGEHHTTEWIKGNMVKVSLNEFTLLLFTTATVYEGNRRETLLRCMLR